MSRERDPRCGELLTYLMEIHSQAHGTYQVITRLDFGP